MLTWFLLKKQNNTAVNIQQQQQQKQSKGTGFLRQQLHQLFIKMQQLPDYYQKYVPSINKARYAMQNMPNSKQKKANALELNIEVQINKIDTIVEQSLVHSGKISEKQEQLLDKSIQKLKDLINKRKKIK